MSDPLLTDLSRRGLLRGGALVGAGALLPGRALAAPGVEAQWPTVTAMLDKYVASRKVAGMVAALGWGANPPGYIARGREGFDDKDPGGPNSLYRAYSMTKPLTGMAAMILIDEGKLGLDQPLADFAPEFAKMQVALDPKAGLAARPTEKLITIRHLLTHTAGLGYAGIHKDAVSEQLKQLGVNAGIVTKRKFPGMAKVPPTPGVDEFLRRTASVPLVAEPGTKWVYSISLDVLGIVIARVAGKPLEQFLAERIFGPAGMDSSFFQVPLSATPRFTTNYFLVGGRPYAIDRPGKSIYQDPVPFAFGGSGLVTSPADYDRFMAMIVNKGLVGSTRVMSERAIALGTSNLLPDGADTKGTYIEGRLFGAGGAIGTGREEGFFGWSGAAGTSGYCNLRLGLRTGLYVQYMPQDKLPILTEFPLAVGKDLTAMGKAPA